MQRLLVVLAALAVLAVLEAGFFLVRSARRHRDDELKRRLRSLGVQGAEVSLLRAGRLAKNPVLDDLLQHLGLARRLERLLERTDLRLTVAQLGGLSLLAGFLVTCVALAFGAPAAPLFGAMALCVPTAVVWSSAERRSARLSEQLPDALEMMARSLRAGHALAGSFQLLASDLPEPIAVDFARAYEAQKLGMPLEHTVTQMAARAPSNRDLKIFAVSVIVQKETGGNLAEILEKIAETVRARYRFFGKLRSLTAEGRMSGLVLAVLPVGMSAFLFASNPTYLRSLFDDPLGRFIAGYAAGSWLLGLVWIKSMTRMEV